MPKTTIKTDITPDGRELEADNDRYRETFALAFCDERGFVCHPHVHRGRTRAVDLSYSGARSRAADGMSGVAQRNHAVKRHRPIPVRISATVVVQVAEAISAVRD
jgi:hypothetical protein